MVTGRTERRKVGHRREPDSRWKMFLNDEICGTGRERISGRAEERCRCSFRCRGFSSRYDFPLQPRPSVPTLRMVDVAGGPVIAKSPSTFASRSVTTSLPVGPEIRSGSSLLKDRLNITCREIGSGDVCWRLEWSGNPGVGIALMSSGRPPPPDRYPHVRDYSQCRILDSHQQSPVSGNPLPRPHDDRRGPWLIRHLTCVFNCVWMAVMARVLRFRVSELSRLVAD